MLGKETLLKGALISSALGLSGGTAYYIHDKTNELIQRNKELEAKLKELQTKPERKIRISSEEKAAPFDTAFRTDIITNGKFGETLSLELKRDTPDKTVVTWRLRTAKGEASQSYELEAPASRQYEVIGIRAFTGSKELSKDSPVTSYLPIVALRQSHLSSIAYDLAREFTIAYTASALTPLSQWNDEASVVSWGMGTAKAHSRAAEKEYRLDALKPAASLYEKAGLNITDIVTKEDLGKHFGEAQAKETERALNRLWSGKREK